MPQFIGHVTAQQLLDSGKTQDEVSSLWTKVRDALDTSDLFVVAEFGTERGHYHYHYYMECTKSKATIHRQISCIFSASGVENPGQFVSCKPANPAKLGDYFRYLCKGPHGHELSGTGEWFKAGWIIYDQSGCRLIEELHREYHSRARKISESRKRKVSGVDFYQELADKCREKSFTSKEDVMTEVTRWYVYDRKKGFDKFACTRTFWAVWSLVNSSDAHSDILQQCLDMVRG